MSRRYAEVIGEPIAHSQSPLIHGFWLDRLGIDADYRAQPVAVANLSTYLVARRADPAWLGCNVTIPHKVSVLSHLDRLTPDAALIGAANLVTVDRGRLIGGNSDAAGFAEPYRGRTAGGTALLLGTGGAARAVFVALMQLGFAPVHVMARTIASGRAFLEAVGRPDATPLTFADRLPAVDLLVNATSLGMAGQAPLTIDLALLPPTSTVYDIVYAPLETPLLAQARARHLRTIDGLTMLIGQAAVAFQAFFASDPPRELDAELRALLVASAL